MNPRQRRGMLLLLVAITGAAAVFVSISNYVADVRALVGPDLGVVALGSEVERYQPITDDMLRVIEMPERFVPEGALARDDVIAGVAAADMPAGTILQQGMVVAPPALNEDESEIAITVDAETGVGGNIRTGDYVDIYATFAGEDRRPSCEARLVTDALILGVGIPSEAAPEDEGQVEPETVVPVRFALNALETEQLVLAESFAHEVRLSLVGPGRLAQIHAGTEQTLPPQPCRLPPGVFEEDAL
ncbi:MAG TPA: Flp pilus assembly protein CpaB [Actinomycetota bacterium]|nr:Flp pilus assembly protein CpaB [Actinomycetota bacterium]